LIKIRKHLGDIYLIIFLAIAFIYYVSFHIVLFVFEFFWDLIFKENNKMELNIPPSRLPKKKQTIKGKFIIREKKIRLHEHPSSHPQFYKRRE